jgi:hypothetical protein
MNCEACIRPNLDHINLSEIDKVNFLDTLHLPFCFNTTKPST